MSHSPKQTGITQDEKSVQLQSLSGDNPEGGAMEGQSEVNKNTLKRRILRVVWDSLDKSPKERKFLAKVDAILLTYVCISYFVKYLDQNNVVNAYVSGMKEDLHMSGQDYNLLQTLFTVGYCLGNLPSQLVMTKVRPSVWLPTLELIWGFLVMAMAAAKNVETLYALRFIVGLLEASAYPGIVTLLGNWYTKEELGKRTCIFVASAPIAQMFSGYLQAGLYSGMDGKHGLRAWQWLFIFNGIIGTPVAIIGYFAIPDSPTSSRAKWLKESDRELATERMERVGRKPARKLTWKVFLGAFKSWPFYIFSIVFASQLLGNRIYQYFNIYLKSTGRYSVEDVNILPTAGYGFAAGMTFIMAWLSDGLRARSPGIYLGASISLIGCIILSVYPEHNLSAMLCGWILTFGQTGATGLIMAYLNELMGYSAEHRLIVIGAVETVGYVMNAWVILLAYPSGDAPRFAVGYQMAAMFFALEIVFITVAALLEKKWKPGPKAGEDEVI